MHEGKIPQVMLFAGPKGTGKTSSARILGALLNDPKNAAVVDAQFFGAKSPKQNEYQEPDPTNADNLKIFAGQSFLVQEMDAASNRGIDDIRALKERVSIPSQYGKMTVYILDEAHMLTTEAFNALLKLLEEPPAHVVFILATTELHKIPATIASRSSMVTFRKATAEELTESMKHVLEQEKIKFDEAALASIASKADGSFRDAVKMLEMVAKEGMVTLEAVNNQLQGSLDEDVKDIITHVLAKDDKALSMQFQELRSKNRDEGFLFKSLLNVLHKSLLQTLEVETGEPLVSKQIALFLLRELGTLPSNPSSIPFLLLEVKLLEVIERSKAKGGAASGVSGGGSTLEKQPPVVESKKKFENPSEIEIAKPVVKPTNASTKPGDGEQLISQWNQLLEAVKGKNATLEALLRSAKPMTSNQGSATVAVYYQFHKDQLENPKFRAVIDECVVPLAGGPVELEYVLTNTPTQADLIEDRVISSNLVALAEEALI
jgi:DNA polymerase III subunit gamma/tau